MLTPSGGSAGAQAFYTHAPQPFDSPTIPSASEILSALGDLTNGLAGIQESVSSLNAKVDRLSDKTDALVARVQQIEEAGPKAKRRRGASTDPELSVSNEFCVHVDLSDLCLHQSHPSSICMQSCLRRCTSLHQRGRF